MFRKMPFILLAIILCIGMLGQWIPPVLQSNFYAVSLLIKSTIIFVLPFVIFGLLFKTAVSFSNKASKLIVFILAAICCSNFFSTMLSYLVGSFAYQFDLSMHFPSEGHSLLPAWEFNFPKLIGNAPAMFTGFISGVLLGSVRPELAKSIALKFEKIVHFLLRGILTLIPLFISGFIVKMKHDQIMSYIFSNYALIFSLIASAVFAYVTLLYVVVNRFQLKETSVSLKNIFPAAAVGFGSMSSAAAMPLTILGTEKNSKNPEMAQSIIPATVNIHLIGDCFAIPIFAFAVMKSFGVEEPSFLNYLTFTLFFVLAKFSVAAVPGGGVLVMLPILEGHLGFSGEMLSLITALYILFDPVITCANILGNGAFAMIIDRVFVYLSLSSPVNEDSIQGSVIPT